MTEWYDSIVVGVGGMGSAAVDHLARRGADVLGLERFDVPHAMGSSHGVTRIIRMAYFEHPSYVALLRRAYENWRDLEADTGRDLLYVTGSVDVGTPDSDVFAGSRRSCEEHDLPHEVLSGDELGERFPAFEFPDRYRAVYQPDGGFLHSEQCVVAHVQRAHEHGATVRARERVTDWRATNGGVLVETDQGRYEADSLVLAPGAWAGDLVPALADRLTPERQVMGWFQPTEPARFGPDAFPVFIADVDGEPYYGTPVHDVPGVKVGKHHHFEETVDPETMLREPRREDEAAIREFADEYLPTAAGPTMGLQTCVYTNTPDRDFVVDVHPEHENVVVAAGFSGHGFKFTSVVGEVVADLATDGETDLPIRRFRMDRSG